MMTTTTSEEIARKVGEKCEAALATLSLVDPGLSKLAGRWKFCSEKLFCQNIAPTEFWCQLFGAQQYIGSKIYYKLNFLVMIR